MMRGNGRTAGAPPDQVYSVHATDKPAPLVDPGHRLEVSERVAADGEVLAPLDLERVRDHVRALISGHQVDAIAIALLWSLRNPAHEDQLRQLERGGVEYVLLIDSTGSKQTLRAFADEIMPEFRNGAAAQAMR